jgi:hypothetical protein
VGIVGLSEFSVIGAIGDKVANRLKYLTELDEYLEQISFSESTFLTLSLYWLDISIKRKENFPSKRERWMIKPRVLVLGLSIIFLSSANILGQRFREKRTVEAIKKLSAEIDQYVKEHEGSDRKFIARKFPLDHSSNKDLWEWKEVKSWDEAKAYVEDYWGSLSVGVWTRDSEIIYVSTCEGSDSGDWAFYVDYYYDEKGRLIQAATDFRTLVDDIKVLDFQYFDDHGQMLDHVVEYYALGWGGNKKLPEKPEHMQNPIWPIPLYVNVADLPIYSLLKTGGSKKNN